MTMPEVGARLGVSSSTVSMALHAAKAPVRPSGGARLEAHDTPRTLITYLYADPYVVVAALRRHVPVPDEADWHVTGLFHSYVPLTVPAALVRVLSVAYPADVVVTANADGFCGFGRPVTPIVAK